MNTKKNLGTIVVSAPTSTGKSVILAKIRDMLKKEYGGGIVLVEDRPMQEPLTSEHKDWEHEMVKDTVWVLTETNKPVRDITS